MSYIKNSNPCCKSELDLFSTNPTNTSIISSSYSTHGPKSAFQKDQKSYEIEVAASDEYIDLNDIYLMTELQLTSSADFKSWDVSKSVGPVNNLAHSIFNKVQVSLFLGNKYVPIELDHSNYAYKAYFLDLLNYNDEGKKGWLQNALFVKDTDGQFDTTTIPITNGKDTVVSSRKSTKFTIDSNVIKTELVSLNDGFLKRREIVTEGKGKIKLISKIHCDLFNSNKLLLNGIGMKFNFTRNEDDFCLMGADKGTVVINKIHIMVRKCMINDEVKKAHQLALKISPLKYPIKITKMFIYAINKETTGNDQEFGLGSVLPNKVIFGIVTDASYQGTSTTNPFKFLDHNLKEVKLVANTSTFNISINEFDKDFSEGYHSICDTLNYYGNNHCPISKDEYLGGNCLFAFNLNPDKGCSDQFNYIRTGNVGLKLKLKTVASENLKIVVLCEYDNQINIDDDYILTTAVNV